MYNYFKDVVFGLFFLVVAFSGSIYFMTTTSLGLDYESGRYQIYSTVLAFIVFAFFLLRAKRIPSHVLSNTLFLGILVIVLFFLTRFFYTQPNARYESHFYVAAAKFLPALLMGAAMHTERGVLEKVEKSLIFFVALYTYLLARFVFSSQLGLNQKETFDTDTGLNYQTISYYSIFTYGLTLYIISYGHYPRWIRVSLFFAAFLQVLLAMMAGGRGAFVLGIVFTLYFGLKRISLLNLLVYISLVAIGLYALQRYMAGSEMMQAGFDRIWGFFSDSEAIEDDIRWERYRLAWISFRHSPIVGHGLGSVFYEIGMYSHDVFLDVLCEGGVLLMGIFLLILFRFYQKSRFLLKVDSRNEIVIIIFLSSFVLLWFSSYYMSDTGFWLMISYTLSAKTRRIFI